MIKTAERLIEESQEIAEKCFDDAKGDVDNQISKIPHTNIEQELNIYLNEFSKQLAAATNPKYLYDEEKTKENLKESQSHEIRDKRFELWFERYKNILKEKPFIDRLTKFAPYLFEDIEVNNVEDGYKKVKTLYDPNPDIQDEIDKFSYKVHLIVLTCFYYRQHLYYYIKDRIKQLKPITGHGLNSELSYDKKEKLYDTCINNKLICESTHKTNFIAAFTNEQLPPDFEPVKFIKVNVNKPTISKSSFNALMKAAKVKRKVNKIIKKCFVDFQGNEFESSHTPGKGKDTYYEAYLELLTSKINK